MKKIGFFTLLALIFSVSFTKAAYIDEYPEAYKWAFKNGITTQKTIEKANMDGEITRIALAKMISNYATNVLKKKVDTSKKCQFSDISDKLNSDYDYGATKACQLGLMGQGITKFRPYDNVTRAEFGTILSRLLWGNKYDGGTPYYKKHVNQLNIRGIMTNIKNLEKVNESRGNVMVMLKRSGTLGDIKIPSFEELNDVTDIKCEYEDDFSGDHYFVNLTKKAFILPYKDGYFTYNIDGQDGLGLYVYYRLAKNPCTTYLNSDQILWWPAEGQNMTKIYKDYDNNVVEKALNCKIGDYEGCYKEVEKYAYNLLIGNETNEYFSLRMDVLKRMVDNKEFDDSNEEGYYIDWSLKHFDCVTNYENKTNKRENISEYCMYELMGLCPGKDFCDKLKPELDKRFGGNNVLYRNMPYLGGGLNIVSDKTYYYNEDYGIQVLLGKAFSGGFIQNNGDKNKYSILFTTYNPNNSSYDLVGKRGQEYAFLIYVFNKDEIIDENKYGKYTYLGKNNKYQFIKKTYDENVNYDDLKIFDVK